MDQDARVTTREGRQGPSTTPFAASTTERESPRIRTRPGTRAAPKNPRNGRQSTTQKLPQHRSTPHRGKTAGAGTRDAQIAPQFHRQTTATTPQSEQNLPTKRTPPRHANRRRPNTKRQQTDTEATRQTTPTHGTNQPPRPRPSRANERRNTHQDTATEDTRRNRTKRQRHPTHRTRDRRKKASTRDNAARRQSPHHNATAQRAQQTAENRGARGQQTEATSDTKPPRHQKHQKHQHGEKPKNKSKTDGSWRQAVEREKVASSETTVRARSTRTTTEEAR